MFVITSMPVGGAETLLVELIRRMDRERFSPELCCLKHYDVLGDALAGEVPAFTGLLSHKYDLRVLGRLTQLMRRRRTDAVVTVGTGGDKMFWGRLAGWLAGVPVICSALHSTGLPDHVEFSNRLLAPLTDAFIAVAEPHACYLAEHEGCPAEKIRVIHNGVDVERFHPRWPTRELQEQWKLDPAAPTIVLTERTDYLGAGPFRCGVWVWGRLEVRDGLVCGWQDYFSTADMARGAVRGLIGMIPGIRRR